MTEQEINELRKLADDIYENDEIADLLPAALDRLASLEEAVRFRSFDEAPGQTDKVDVKMSNGDIISGKACEILHLLEMHTQPNVRAVGWRYQVGDLG